MNNQKFLIKNILNFFFTIELKQFLNKSNIIKQKLIFNMQRNTSKYQIKKTI